MPGFDSGSGCGARFFGHPGSNVTELHAVQKPIWMTDASQRPLRPVATTSTEEHAMREQAARSVAVDGQPVSAGAGYPVRVTDNVAVTCDGGGQEIVSSADREQEHMVAHARDVDTATSRSSSAGPTIWFVPGSGGPHLHWERDRGGRGLDHQADVGSATSLFPLRQTASAGPARDGHDNSCAGLALSGGARRFSGGWRGNIGVLHGCRRMSEGGWWRGCASRSPFSRRGYPAGT